MCLRNLSRIKCKPAAHLVIFVAHTAGFYGRDENRRVSGGLQRRQATENRS